MTISWSALDFLVVLDDMRNVCPTPDTNRTGTPYAETPEACSAPHSELSLLEQTSTPTPSTMASVRAMTDLVPFRQSTMQIELFGLWEACYDPLLGRPR